jgi:hypothetical protein
MVSGYQFMFVGGFQLFVKKPPEGIEPSTC